MDENVAQFIIPEHGSEGSAIGALVVSASDIGSGESI